MKFIMCEKATTQAKIIYIYPIEYAHHAFLYCGNILIYPYSSEFPMGNLCDYHKASEPVGY